MARQLVSSYSGQSILTGVFIGAVLIAGGYGAMIGTIRPEALRHITIEGITLFHPTRVGMALFGMSATGLFFACLFLALRLATHFDEHAHP